MIVKPIEFGGCCNNCAPNNYAPVRGGVRVSIEHSDEDDDCDGEMICLRCASRLANRLVVAVAECQRRRRAGEGYRHDKWSKPVISRKARAAATKGE